MKIGFDARSLMDSQYSGISEYTLNLLFKILEHDKKNIYKFFYNSARGGFDVLEEIKKTAENAEVIGTRYPNKIFNYFMQKGFSYPKIDKLLDVDVFYAPHFNFFSLF